MMYVCPSKQKERIPAMVHIDGTCRVQSLSASDNPKYHALISRFFDLTGVPTVLNTSYNAGGEPLCETPLDSLNTFTKMSKLKALFIFDKDEETCFVVSRETVQTDDELEIEAARRKAQRKSDREADMRKVKEPNRG